ncbi:MAG TPA: hypothetical protein VG456_02125 [Candidatus Sulfopaludibacter sp.]|nr:hypothetical protein [Candidatus Sulfopaludibacter sp.]
MEFRAAARHITADMSLLTGLISGKQARHAALALDAILTHSRDMDASVTDSGSVLAALRNLAGQLYRAFSGIPATVSVLRNLCTLTRVETARLANHSLTFADLAAEVMPLSESIQASGASVLECASHLDLGLQTALQTASLLRVRQSEELPPLIATVTAGIRELADRQQAVHDASLRQASAYQQLSDAIDGLVANLQFHDITRQQIEHVIETLDLLRSETAPPRSVVVLQASQLRNSSQIFSTAARSIEQNLENIGVRLGELASNSRSLLGESAGDHDSFFLRMEESFTAILQAMSACAEAQAEVRATPAHVSALMDRMRSAIEDIRALEIRIERTALNASIRAVHLGPAGAPLAVIAEAMQRLVAESSSKTEEAGQTLAALVQSAAALCGDDSLTRAAAEDDARMRAAVAEMQTAAEISYSRVTAIVALGERLAEDIAGLRGSFTHADVCAAGIDRAAEELETIAAELPDVEPVGAPENSSLASRYTMQIERDIHDRVMQGAPAAAAEPLGDNVELW